MNMATSIPFMPETKLKKDGTKSPKHKVKEQHRKKDKLVKKQKQKDRKKNKK